VNDHLKRTAWSLLGHACLVGAVLADSLFRSGGFNSSPATETLIKLVIALLLLFGGGMFVLRPRRFFLLGEERVVPEVSARGWPRLLAWIFVTCLPLLWLLGIAHFQSFFEANSSFRLLAAYVFFFWIASSILLSPYLFQRKR
jgi:hypothetical protein